MRLLDEPLSQLEWFNEALEKLNNKNACMRVCGVIDSQKLHMISALSENQKATVIVTYSERRARELCQEYSFYNKDVLYYPSKDLIFYQADINGKQLSIERIRALKEIVHGNKVTIVTTLDAFMTPMPPLEILKDSIFTLEKDGIVDERAVAIKLVRMGYEKVYQVEQPGEFSVRGGILDIFDLTNENPYRIELWGDEITSIREFDLYSQRSIDEKDSITIYPASELMLSDTQKAEGFHRIEDEAKELIEKYRSEFKTEEAHRLSMMLEELQSALITGDIELNLEGYISYFYEKTINLFKAFGDEPPCMFLDEPIKLIDHIQAVWMEFVESMTHRLEKGYILPGQLGLLCSVEECVAEIARGKSVSLSAMVLSQDGNSIFKYDGDYYVNAKMLPSINGSFTLLIDNLKDLKKKGYRVVILSPSRTRAARLAEDITNEGVICSYTENSEKVLQKGEIVTFYGSIKQGFEYCELKYTVISESDLFGQDKKKRRLKPKYTGGQKVNSYGQLQVGDYVIHENHGLGIYKGIEKVKVENVAKDYMKIEYREGGILYVLATNLDAIGLYASKEGKKPKLNKLGSKEWINTRAKVQTAVEGVAKELVHLYAVRSERKGHQFIKDTVWQREFEEMFPFEETDDQLAAIAATKDDMESTKIMDRLVCGDVGFGKTEVAIRGAFKAVQDGKQVAYLVPTTILAQQHYNTFVERMKDYPVRVEMLSRFRTAAQIKKTLADLKKGLVDIVIGTHRLLSKDVEFSDLGLLIIDEEQRFGVSHKEKIKQLKENVDVLTLTATPIPRTLHMSLIGIRDMSLLEEAPQDRMPIQTFVMEYNEEMIREAINRELARDGQIYYVYNRVDGIESVASRIAALVPDAKVSFAHGQMNERELENIMMDFINHDIDVLVCTTIIETGLDIPNVNTMIIHDSDSLGLSQLYQLRGRVGRSNRTSFAFLMYKRNKILKEVAEKRLLAIKEFTELGSGFKIAMRDLEIRGTGNLLGKQQHGHVEAVGYDLYCKMLEEAIREEQGETVVSDVSATVDLDVDAYIPEEYIVNEVQKLDIYKRIACLKTTEDADDMRDELRDRFGTLPKQAQNLLRVAVIKQTASAMYVKDLRGRVGRIKITLPKNAPVKVENIPFFLNEYAGNLKIETIGDPCFILTYKELAGLVEKDEIILLEKTEELLSKMDMLYKELEF